MIDQSDLDHMLFQLWGKYSRTDDTIFHPLIYHLLDTSAVALEMWHDCLSDSFKKEMASSFGIPLNDTGKLLAFWVGLHDIGKAGPEFQRKNPERLLALANLGLSFPSRMMKPDGFHATATTLIVRRLLQQQDPTIPRRFRNAVSTALGGHHGEFPSSGQITQDSLIRYHIGDDTWQALQNDIGILLISILHPPLPSRYPETTTALNPVLMQLTGFTTTADWISSNEEYFAFVSPTIPPDHYFNLARQKARHALKSLGWLGWKSTANPLNFKELFPSFSPNTLQESIINSTESLTSPFLAIIEAQTGSGKTEAALYLTDRLLQTDRLSGFYVAMPTQATSNQMYGRVKRFLAQRYPEDNLNLHLVHGNSLLHGRLRPYTPTNIWAEEDESNIHSHSWFLPRKKTLLAPFGVGTVDQTFYSILQSRFFFLRLFGLSHKVLIFDEVHAYDAYMNEIFSTLLQWLRMVGTSVIILTATLPESTKNALVNAYTGRLDPLNDVSFPRITIADNTHTQVLNAGNPENRNVKLTWIDRDVETIAELLENRLIGGGCAAVVCNTVKRAQQIFTRLRQNIPEDDTVMILFHSSYPFGWRKQIEDRVLELFGKDRSSRPFKAVLVATQVIEQSLDLDFDLMVTDLAPIDLLIQRIGRLHRHQAGEGRPPFLSEPECIISSYTTLDAILSQGSDIYVYDPYILAKSWLNLKDKNILVLPQESDELIRYVYEDRATDPPALETARTDMDNSASKSRQNAHNYLLPDVDKDFISSQPTFFGDDPQSLSRRLVNAPTREIDPTIQIVCLEEKGDGLHILDDPQTTDLNAALTQTKIIQCLVASATISNRAFVARFFENPIPAPQLFQSNAALRWHIPIIFRDGRSECNGFELILDREKGLSTQKLTQS
jgi:CRISPR-associated endonuclease/helicase Cas3